MATDGRIVGPGDTVLKLPETGSVKLGTGAIATGGEVRSTVAGVLRRSKGNKSWIETRRKRYTPAVGESIIGLIVERGMDWQVDIKGPFHALLPADAFEGVTRRNRPNLQPGDLVYARVTQVQRAGDPTIACTDADGKASGYGQLKDGWLETISTALARKLLSSPTAAVLTALGEHFQYEAAIGINGRLWLRAEDQATTILVSNAILASEFLSDVQCQTLVRRLVSDVQHPSAK